MVQVFVRSVQGAVVVASPCAEATVAELKAMVAERDGVPAELYALECNGKILADEAVVADCVSEDAFLSARVELLGAGKKRKKKTFTKPKKIAHKHKNIKLRTLRFYQVDNAGKVTRLRRECPKEECGAGVFMGNYFGRLYCGKCGFTLKLANKS